MPLTCGVDIENAYRVERLHLLGLLPEDIFLASEKSCMRRNKSLSSVFFTAKEAVLKALGLGWSLGQSSGREIELHLERDGVAGVRLHGTLKERFRSMGYRFIAIAHDQVGKDQMTEVIMGGRRYACPARCKVIVRVRDVAEMLERDDSADARIHSLDPRRTLTTNEHAELRFRKKTSYIAGRMAAKQCVHHLLKTMGSGALCKPEELEILSDPAGRPFLHDARLPGLEMVPAVSISHSRDHAVAVAVAYHDWRNRTT